ncbi:MAG: T9SS type A sorting domain-containing protein [Bacteroidota bacterium]
MKNFSLSILCLILSLSSYAQNCPVPNGDFQSWETVRLERPFSTDSIDFFWPEGWSPFIWNGVDDFIEPALPGPGGMGDSAVTMFSTEFDASVSRYFFCTGKPTAFTFDYAHDGAADDSMQILVLGVNVDTVGSDDIDSLVADVILDEVPYTEVYSTTETIGGGAQNFTSYSMPLIELDSVTIPNLFIVAFIYNRSLNAPVGQKTTYSVDNAALSFTTTQVEPGEKDFEPIILFPNPVSDVLNIRYDFTKPHRVKVLNAQGQVVQSSFLNATQSSLLVDELSAGVYLLMIENEHNQRVGVSRFVKK